MTYISPVIKGKGRGKKIVGFPTLNLAVPGNFSAKEGVYAAKVWAHDSEYRGALHFGHAPTFDDSETTLEIFLLNYEDAQPITNLKFELGPYLRPIATFLSPVDLRRQIALDVQRVRRANF